MREMSASRASLSMLEISSRDDGRPMSESSGSEHTQALVAAGGAMKGGGMYKSLENFEVRGFLLLFLY